MRRTSFAKFHCSLARALEQMGDWWTPLVLRDLFLGVSRFDDLVEDLGISRNLLAQRLKALVRAGIVERRAYQERPRRYEYVLGESGRDLVPVLTALTAWGDRWAAPRAGKPMLLVHRSCGKEIAPRVSCPDCGEALTAESVSTKPGPGRRVGPGTRLLAGRLSRDTPSLP